MILVVGTLFYLFLCFFSLPISLLLHGSIFKRIALGLAAPVLGMVLGALTAGAFDRMHFLDGRGDFVFVIVAIIPILLLLVWGIVGRVKANDL